MAGYNICILRILYYCVLCVLYYICNEAQKNLRVHGSVSYGGERLEDYIKTCSIIRMVGVNNSENEYFLI